MNLVTFDNIIKDVNVYVNDIHKSQFQDISDGISVFKNIQPRDGNDEFGEFCLSIFPNHTINWNFIRKSPLNQLEPNYIHTDEMMGDITCILYLNKNHPVNDGTIIYDEEGKTLVTIFSKLNRMIAFNSEAPHSRSIIQNFGQGEDARLIQIVFLKSNDR